MFLKLYLVSLPIFLLLDAIWLSFVAKGFYAKHIGFLMKGDINFVAAAIFYLLFVAGIVVFVLNPSLKEKSWVMALGLGALFGLISYATYDLTNLATIKNWPLVVTIVDLIWGALVSSLVSVTGFFIAKKLGV